MPEGGKLDRCHDEVKKSLENKGMDPGKADGVAWGICKKTVHDETVETDKAISEAHKEMERLKNT